MNTFYNMTNLSTRNSNYPIKTIADLAQNRNDLSILVKALNKTNMLTMLSSQGPFTLFAPSNDAFSRLGNGVLKELINNPDKLKKILTYHLTLGKYFSNHLYNGQELRMENSEVLIVKINKHIKLVNKAGKELARIKIKDIWGTNGILYVIDRVMLLKTEEQREKIEKKSSQYYQPPSYKKSITVPTKNVPLNSMFQTFRTGRMGCGCGG